MVHARLVAALALLGSVALVVVGVLTERWVVEVKDDTRVVLGPRRMEVCGEGRCRETVYTRSIAAIEARLARAGGEKASEERERLEAALERMRFHRKKGLQILAPGLVAAGLFGALGGLLLLPWGRRFAAFSRGSVRFLTCGLALGLVAFALVYADGVSHLPADGALIRWGSSFYLVLGGSTLAFVGGVLSGVGAPSAD